MSLLDDPILLAREIGDGICAVAEPVDGGCRWLSRDPEEEGESYCTSVYLGAAGIACFLLNLFERTREAPYRDVALRALPWLESQAAAGEEYLSRPGLYAGRGGLAYVYTRAAAITGDPALLRNAEEHAWACRAMEPEYTELFFGTAGSGLMLLHLHRVTGNPEHLRWAEAAGDALLGQAERVGQGIRWSLRTRPAADPQVWNPCFTGIGHGAAGIGCFLAELFRATRAPRFAEAVRGTAGRLIEVAIRPSATGSFLPGARPTGSSGCDVSPSQVWVWDRFDPASDAEKLVQWCHGAPGNGLFFLRGFTVLGDPELREAAERCAEATLAAGDVRENPCQCHGLCGNAELFLDLYRALDDSRYLEMARQFGGLALKYRRETERGVEWQSHTAGVTTPDYLVGSAGVGQFFLRLAGPRATPMPFLDVD
jgi:lantibiotic modifying enzyme